MRIKVDFQLNHIQEKEIVDKGEEVGKGSGQIVGGRCHCIMVRSFDFILGATADL